MSANRAEQPTQLTLIKEDAPTNKRPYFLPRLEQWANGQQPDAPIVQVMGDVRDIIQLWDAGRYECKGLRQENRRLRERYEEEHTTAARKGTTNWQLQQEIQRLEAKQRPIFYMRWAAVTGIVWAVAIAVTYLVFFGG